MNINTQCEACQYEIEKVGEQNYQLLIMLFCTYLTVPVSEFQNFSVRNMYIWEKEGITDPLVLMNYA